MREKLYRLSGLTLLVTALVVPAWAQQNIDPRLLAYADMVFYNGKVLTADDEFTIVEAVAIRDGKILARGETSDILRLAGPNTRRIDLAGNNVIPGFIESHSHGWVGQLLKRSPDGFVIFNTLEAGLEQVRKLVERAPAGKLVQFGSLRNPVALKVTRWELDKIAPNNPVLISFSTYEFNTNSLALKIALDYFGTEDYPGVVKDPETGEPNGHLRGLASGVLGYEILPWPDLAEVKVQELRRMQGFSSKGISMVIGRAPGLAITGLRDIWIEGNLPVRLRITHEFLRDNPEPEKFLKRIGNLTGLGDDWLRIIGTLTQQPDGSASPGGMLTSRPKLRLAPKDAFGLFGQNRWLEYSNAEESIKLAVRYGWKIASVHSYGDESTRLLLKAYEEASAGKELPGGPWIIDHNYTGTEETIALMQKLKVIPSVLTWWRQEPPREGGGRSLSGFNVNIEDLPFDLPTEGQAGFTPQLGDALVYMYGADRLNDDFSMGRRFIDAGLRPVIESVGRNPLLNMEVFITRKDGLGRVWAPQEKVTRKEALWMKTRWAAYISGDEDKLGSLEEGKLADLVVLGGDYLAVPEEQISDLPILMTVVDGKVTYEKN